MKMKEQIDLNTTVSIRSIDVGFDPRAVGDGPLLLPVGTTTVLCDLPERDGYVGAREGAITGTPTQILKRLRGLGYSVRYYTPEGA